MMAILEIARRRRRRELRDQTALMALAFRGKPEALQRALADDGDA